MLGGKPAKALVAAVLVVLAVNGSADAQDRLVAYGDSYVNPGTTGMRHGQAPWVRLLGQPVVNHGHGGDGVARTLTIVRRTAYEARGDVVLEVGLNDVRRSGTDPSRLATFRRQYDALLDLLGRARLVVVVLPLPVQRWGTWKPFDRGSEAALEAYRVAVVEVAAEHRNVRVADPLPAWQPERMLLRDGVHPNAAGRAVIAATVRSALS